MLYHKIITLKDGRTCVLRNGTAEDGEALLKVFNLTHAQTDYLLTYPEELEENLDQYEHAITALNKDGRTRFPIREEFYDELDKHDGSISFTMANVRDIFKKDDLTLVNFEGTFTNTKNVPDNKKGNDFLFNISPEYVTVLTDNYIEA